MTEQLKGWLVSESLAMELDTALTILGGYYTPEGYPIPESLASLVESAQDEWLREWGQYFTQQGELVSLLSTLSLAAGIFTENDYTKLTLKLREMDVTRLMEHLREKCGEHQPTLSGSMTSDELAIEMLAFIDLQSYANLGLTKKQRTHPTSAKHSFTTIPRILKGGDLNTRFWHWLDRFYYQSYEPWRTTRDMIVQKQKEHALSALRTSVGSTPPEVDWLPPQNPVLRIPEINSAIAEGQIQVIFWVEPFGLIDNWGFWQGCLVTSFAEPGELYENFRAYAVDIAGRAKALADPTRLTILRIIRHFGMNNTDIATFLDLARPTVSIHAKILQEAGLIRSTKVGRETKHEIIHEEVHLLFEDLKGFLALTGIEKETSE